MAITEIQSASDRADTADKAPKVTLGDNPTIGNLLIAKIGWSQGSGNASCKLNGWTTVPVDGDVSISGKVRLNLFYKIAGADESQTVKGTLSSNRRWTIEVVEVHSSTGSGGWVFDKSKHNSSTGTAATSGTTTTTAAADEYWVAGFATQDQATLATPLNSFTIKEQQVPGNSGSTYVSGALLTRIVSAAATASTGGTYNRSRAWVGSIATFYVAIVTVPLSANLTGQGRLTATPYFEEPTLTIVAAFGSGPGDTSPTWTDITDYVRSCNWQRGRQNELNQTQAGTGSLTLRDPESHFDPSNTDSPFYPDVKPGMPIRATLAAGVNAYPLFYMFAERIPRTSRVTSVYTERQIDMIDGFALLANAGLAGFIYPEQLSSERVTAVLDDIEWSTYARQIGQGVAPVQAEEFPIDNDARAQTHLLGVNDSENGFLFCNGAGELVFVGRRELISDPRYTTSQVIYSDISTSVSVVPGGFGDGDFGDELFGDSPGTAMVNSYRYVDLVPSYDLDNVFNKWVVTPTDLEPQTWEDFPSQQDYFLRVKQVPSLVTTEGEALNQAQYKSGQFSQPLNRVESITIMPLIGATTSSTSTFPVGIGYGEGLYGDDLYGGTGTPSGGSVSVSSFDQLDAGFGREVGDRITVQETPPGFSTVQENVYVIQSLRGQFNPGPNSSATLQFLLWPASLSSFWIVGDEEQSLIGVSTRPGY